LVIGTPNFILLEQIRVLDWRSISQG